MTLVGVCALQEALLEYLPVGLRLPGLVQWVLRYTPKVWLMKQVIHFSPDDPNVFHTRIVFLATYLKCDMSNAFLPLGLKGPWSVVGDHVSKPRRVESLVGPPALYESSASNFGPPGTCSLCIFVRVHVSRKRVHKCKCSQANENGGYHSRHGGRDMWG